MPKYRPVYTKIWKDRDFLKSGKDAKLLFLYFVTNESRNNSGIYEIPIDTISRENSIRSQTVRELLANGSIKNIQYDMENEIVFVVNAHKYSSGGNPEKVAKGIVSEFEQSSKSPLWEFFLDRYPAFKDILPTVGERLGNRSLPLPLDSKELNNKTPSPEKAWKTKKQEAFEKRWSDYPGRLDGKKAANGHWNASINKAEDIERYDIATGKYLESVRYERNNGFQNLNFKHGKTWFNNWQDYIPDDDPPEETDIVVPAPPERVRGEPELEKLWDNTLERIEAQIAPEAFEKWFNETYPRSLAEGVIVIAVPNQFTRKCLIENYQELIETTTRELHGSPVLVDFCIESQLATA